MNSNYSTYCNSFENKMYAMIDVGVSGFEICIRAFIPNYRCGDINEIGHFCLYELRVHTITTMTTTKTIYMDYFCGFFLTDLFHMKK